MSDDSLNANLSDPLLVYATRVDAVAPDLLRICKLDFRQVDESVAQRGFSSFREAAEKGSAFAMCMCSRFCRTGWGVPQSNVEAFRWAEKAGVAGYAPGHYEVGKCYEEGIGVLANLDRARQCYEEAAEGGFGFAAYHLAEMYSSGKFGDANVVKAIERAKWADHLNEPMASLLLAKWYEEGIGVGKDLNEAVSWYFRAADLGNFFASFRLSMAYQLGELGLPKDQDKAKKYQDLCSIQTLRT